MNFLKNLVKNPSFIDIDIRSKEDLEGFIELLELSMKTLIKEDYFFEEEEQKLTNYILSLKALVPDWILPFQKNVERENYLQSVNQKKITYFNLP